MAYREVRWRGIRGLLADAEAHLEHVIVDPESEREEVLAAARALVAVTQAAEDVGVCVR